MAKKQKFKYTGALVLGMHDAMVSLIGVIVGLTFALADNSLIILTGIIASVSAGLSMGAANYLAEKADGNRHPLIAGLCTGTAYLITSALLLIPFAVCRNAFWALGLTATIAVLIIFAFNFCISRIKGKSFTKPFF